MIVWLCRAVISVLFLMPTFGADADWILRWVKIQIPPDHSCQIGSNLKLLKLSELGCAKAAADEVLMRFSYSLDDGFLGFQDGDVINLAASDDLMVTCGSLNVLQKPNVSGYTTLLCSWGSGGLKLITIKGPKKEISLCANTLGLILLTAGPYKDFFVSYERHRPILGRGLFVVDLLGCYDTKLKEPVGINSEDIEKFVKSYCSEIYELEGKCFTYVSIGATDNVKAKQ